MIQEPTAVFAWLAFLVALTFWAASLPAMQRWFKAIPPIIHCYFLPTISTALGITPLSSPAYDWMTGFLLPIALFLLMVSVDVPAILSVGPKALLMMLAGTVGIIIGAPIAFLVFSQWLPPDAWKGLAALAGSWIGGSANFVAIAESVGAPDAMLGPAIVVDTVVGYGWMAILLLLSGYQDRFDRWIGASSGGYEEASRRAAAAQVTPVTVSLRALVILVGVGFAAAVVAINIGKALPPLGSPTIISHTTWAVLAAVTAGLALSFTPMRRLENLGASEGGYAALYLLVAAIGAQANVRAIVETPVFLATGVLWIAIHIAVLLLVARLIRAPLFFVAVGSMANIGGAASAPVVAGVYNRAMAPVGLLLGVSGYILGIYGGLLAAWLLGQVGT